MVLPRLENFISPLPHLSRGRHNASDGPLGCFGLNRVEESGKRFLSYLSINHRAVITTFFKKSRYATWIHPRSKKKH